jgi:putative pyrroloquinoline-quinone binding quinoprotein
VRTMSRSPIVVTALAVLLLTGTSVAHADRYLGSSSAPVRVLRHDGPGHGPDYSTGIAVTPDGSRFFVTGYVYGGPTRGDDYSTIAADADGTPLWGRSYNGPDSNIDEALDVAVSTDGRTVYVTGYSFGGPATTNDATTIAYDALTGRQLWVARYDGPGHDTDVGVDVAVAPDGESVFVTGASIGTDGMLDVLTLAYDASTGIQSWVARHGEANAAADEGLSLGVSPDGGLVFVTGYQTSVDADFLTVAYDAQGGGEVWSRSIDAGGDELGRSLVVAPDGSSVYVTGYRSGVPGGAVPLACFSGEAAVGDDYLTAAYDATSGTRRWLRNYDGPDHDCDQAYAIAVDPAGSAVFVTGSSFAPSSDFDVATVAYAGADGSELWTARYDGPDHLYDAGDSLVLSPNGRRLYVAGSSVGASTDYDFVTLFYDAASGVLSKSERYDGPGHGFDAPNAIAAGSNGRFVYVTGGSTGTGLSPDFATVVYRA